MSELDLWWFLADTVRVLHVLVVLVIAFTVILSGFGFTHRHTRIALVVWPSVGIYLVWQIIPGCPITDLELWLRHQVAPSWMLPVSLPQHVAYQITGINVSPNVFSGLAILLGIIGAYGFGRYHLTRPARKVLLFLGMGRSLSSTMAERELPQRD